MHVLTDKSCQIEMMSVMHHVIVKIDKSACSSPAKFSFGKGQNILILINFY